MPGANECVKSTNLFEVRIFWICKRDGSLEDAPETKPIFPKQSELTNRAVQIFMCRVLTNPLTRSQQVPTTRHFSGTLTILVGPFYSYALLINRSSAHLMPRENE